MNAELARKLGLKPGMDALVIARPDDLAELLPLPTAELAQAAHAFVLVFVAIAADVSRALAAASHYRDGDRLWCAYPKLTGALASDISRDRGWEPLGAAGFIGVTQVAIDANWSALRFRRVHEVPKLTRRGAQTL